MEVNFCLTKKLRLSSICIKNWGRLQFAWQLYLFLNNILINHIRQNELFPVCMYAKQVKSAPQSSQFVYIISRQEAEQNLHRSGFGWFRFILVELSFPQIWSVKYRKTILQILFKYHLSCEVSYKFCNLTYELISMRSKTFTSWIYSPQ